MTPHLVLPCEVPVPVQVHAGCRLALAQVPFLPKLPAVHVLYRQDLRVSSPTIYFTLTWKCRVSGAQTSKPTSVNVTPHLLTFITRPARIDALRLRKKSACEAAPRLKPLSLRAWPISSQDSSSSKSPIRICGTPQHLLQLSFNQQCKITPRWRRAFGSAGPLQHTLGAHPYMQACDPLHAPDS